MYVFIYTSHCIRVKQQPSLKSFENLHKNKLSNSV